MKKLLRFGKHTFIITITTFLLAEICIYFTFPLFFNKTFSRADIKQQILLEADSASSQNSEAPYKLPTFVENKVLHPYLGFVHNPPESIQDWSSFYGFENEEIILKKSSDKIIIAISGGSFAQGLYRSSKNIIIDAYKKYPAFKDKKIEVVDVSLGGYKQPQQLMALNYFLALGAEFDIWINLDGFNEINLPYVENYLNGVSLIYPRLWMLYAKKSFNRPTLDLMTEINQLRSERKKQKLLFQNLRASSICLLLWKKFDLKNELREYKLNDELNKSLSGQLPSYQTSGPFEKFTNDFQAITKSAQIWQNSSLQMHQLCAANGIQYFHFLQPNQYIQDSKTMGPEERNIAYESGPYIFKDVTKVGYPLLLSAGEELKKQNVAFHDLTMIFRDETQILYSDKLCHINKAGNEIVAKKITNIITNEYIFQ